MLIIHTQQQENNPILLDLVQMYSTEIYTKILLIISFVYCRHQALHFQFSVEADVQLTVVFVFTEYLKRLTVIFVSYFVLSCEIHISLFSVSDLKKFKIIIV